MAKKKAAKNGNGNGANLGFEATLWLAADKLRSNIVEHGHVLTPGRYVGAAEVEEDDEPFEEKMRRLVGELDEQFAESRKLEKAIRKNLAGIGCAAEEPV